MLPSDAASLEAHCLAAVTRVRPIAEAHARDADRDSTLHPAVVAAMRAEGLFGLVAPREVGGAGAPTLTQLAAFETMAHAEPSAGWSWMIGAITTAMMGAYLGEVAVARIFDAGMPIAAGLHMPMGRARPVRGGFEISGRWGFGSGIRHADWVFTAAAIESDAPPAGPPPMILVAVPANRVRVEPTWDTTLLRGSGSNHYRMEAVFVDEAFTCPYPAPPRRRGGSFFELPFIALVAAAHIGFALGVAQRALDEVADNVAPRRVRIWSQELLRDGNGFRLEFGRASMQLAAARSLGREMLGSISARMEVGGVLDAADWSATRATTTYATEVAAQVTTFAFRAGGASSLGAGSVLERCLRDIHAALQHVSASDEAYDFATRVRLGEPLAHPFYLPRPKRAAASAAA